MQQPLVSVVMPAYNAERYIAASVRSALAQTYQNWELIIVDDGSTDGTAAVAKGFADADARVRYVYQKNGRLGNARNTGIRHARGPLVAFLDSDDLWMEEKLELQVRAMEESGADIVFTDGFIFYDDDVRDESLTFSTASGRLSGGEMADYMLPDNRIPVLSVMVRKSWLDRVGPFDEEELCEDYDLWLRSLRLGAVFYGMPEKLVRYRRHGKSLSQQEGNLLRPTIHVLRKHSDVFERGRGDVRAKIRELYRELISYRLRQGRVGEARQFMEEFAAWGGGWVTPVQKVLLSLSPGAFDFVSRKILYRAEFHAARLLGRSSPTTPPAGRGTPEPRS